MQPFVDQMVHADRKIENRMTENQISVTTNHLCKPKRINLEHFTTTTIHRTNNKMFQFSTNKKKVL